MKKLGFMFVILLSLLVSSVHGALSFDYNIERVDVAGTTASEMPGATEVTVERGQALPIDVWVHAVNSVDNVRVEASLKGYERGSVHTESDIFGLDANTLKKVSLVLEIPSDLDASETHTLVIEVNDKQNGVLQEYSIRVKEKRHLLNVLDVIFRPSSTVEAGRFLRTVVRLENLGGKDEKDIKVTVSIPSLGVSTRDFVDKLVTLNNDKNNKDDQSSLSTNELVLQIPKDAKEGDYEVRVDVEFNRGSDIQTLKGTVHVSGGKETAETNTIISVDSTSQTLEKNEEGTYRLTFANLGDTRKLYNVEVVGAETWGDVTVEPGFTSVGPSEAGSLLVKVKPKTGTAAGTKVFTVKVNENNKLVKEVNLNTNISESSSFGAFSTRKVLEVLFAILIVVLIVLALVVAFRKARGQGPGVETNSEQTYY